jgi:hypothetical protein
MAGAGGRGFASPVTFPSAPVVPLAPTLLPVSYADERWDPTRLATSQPVAALPGTDGQPDRPDVDASRVVVGYLRTATPGNASGSLTVDDTEPDATDEALVESIAQYARERGLTLLRVHRDDVTDDDARRPGFSACLRHLYLREASAIVIPGWDHLAPNEVLRRALCHNATSAGGTIQVINPA